MFRSKVMAAAIAVVLALPAVGRAQTAADLEEIRKQIKELKDGYETRIQALEQRLKDAEAATAKADQAANQAKASADAAQLKTQAAAAPAQRQASPNAFNPGISLILQGTYKNFSKDPATYAVTGYAPAPDAGADFTRGFSLSESEITMSANVDHLFYGQATFAIAPEGGIDTEEAFFQTLGLGHGLTVKGGRFFSAIGYQNSLHAHAWDFVDPALVQGQFLGANYADDGLQLSWIAPLPIYLELGGEVGRGLNPPGTDRSKNGIGAGTLFAHLGGDIGDSSSYRVGIWGLQTGFGSDGISVTDLDARTEALNVLREGNTKIYGLDFVYKWAPNGNSSYTNFKFIAEIMRRVQDGQLSFDDDAALGLGPSVDAFKIKQTGWYVQGIYQFHPNWRVGLRYDQLQKGSLEAGINAANGVIGADYDPKRYSAMLDWNPSEFSRIRLQWNVDKANQEQTDNQIFLQYIYSLGTHGAHKF